MSRIRADKIANKDGTGAVQLQYGAEVPVGYGITGAGTINLNGNIQSANLSGGGAGITGINASNISSGTIGAARLPSNLNTTGTAGGLTGTPDITVNNVVAAAATFSGNVSIGGTLTYEDVTNIDSVGLITARDGINVTGNVDCDSLNNAGISTLTGAVTMGGQLTVDGGFYVGGEVGLFNGSTNAGRFIDCGLGDGNALTIRGCSGGDANHETLASFTRNAGVVLAYDNATKFQTTNTGAIVTGIATATGGISLPTVNTYIKGNGSNSVLQVDATRTYFYGGSDGIQVRKADNSLPIIIVDDSGNTNVAGGLTIGTGVLAEKVSVQNGSGFVGSYGHHVLSWGMVLYGGTNPAGSTWQLDMLGNGTTTFNSLMAIGETTTMTMYAASDDTAKYMTAFKIDGTTQTVKWAGGTAPSAATGSGTDVYSMTIMKTANATFTVFGNFTNFA